MLAAVKLVMIGGGGAMTVIVMPAAGEQISAPGNPNDTVVPAATMNVPLEDCGEPAPNN